MDSLPTFVSYLIVLLSPAYVILSITAALSRRVELLRALAAHGKTREEWHSWWSIYVPKSYFTYFYVVGLLSAASIFRSTTKISWTQWSLVLHLCRRLYECLYVHNFRPGSEMHVAGFILGIGHYLVLPLVFLKSAPRSETTFLNMTCFAGNFWMQYEQHIHHKILANTRKGSSNKSAYSLPPNFRWFRWSLCPHYFAEILIYTFWAILLSQLDDFPLGTMTFFLKTSYYENALHLAATQRHWFLLMWVMVNLTVSALNNHDWYVQHYPKMTKAALFSWPYLAL